MVLSWGIGRGFDCVSVLSLRVERGKIILETLWVYGLSVYLCMLLVITVEG